MSSESIGRCELLYRKRKRTRHKVDGVVKLQQQTQTLWNCIQVQISKNKNNLQNKNIATENS